MRHISKLGGKAAQSASRMLRDAGACKGNIMSTKTIKANSLFTGAEFADAKQLYRFFRETDKAAYVNQGHATICALRKGQVAALDKAVRGTDVALVTNGEQGIACMVGKKLDARTCAAGVFAVRFDSKYKLQWFTSWSAFAQFIRKEGQVVKINGEVVKMLQGKKYSFYVGKDGKVKRHEFNTCSRGKAFFGKLN